MTEELKPGTEVYITDNGKRFARGFIRQRDYQTTDNKKHYWVRFTAVYPEGESYIGTYKNQFAQGLVDSGQDFTVPEEQIKLVDPLTLLAETAE